MSADRSFGQGLASVTVVLVDGQSHAGQLGRFSPATPDLAISTNGGRLSFATERVAYVAFHRSAGGPPAPPSARRGALKVHVHGGLILTVDPEPGPPGPLGFY
ncbi:MAG TPA: hypothetical protein VJV79_19905, partial [Polyangiaceae bacterium]|nr:hypothetical protein [Polyangiaceae bacterium]